MAVACPMEPVAKIAPVLHAAAHQPLPKAKPAPKQKVRLVATPVKASELIAEATQVLSGQCSAPTPRPARGDTPGSASSRSRSETCARSGARPSPALARIDGVVNQMQQELDEVRAFSDHCWEAEQKPEAEPCVQFQEPEATLRHPAHLNPTFVYTTVRHQPLIAPNWHWELQNRKSRANAEHIVKIESEWAQRVKEAEEAAGRSDERARLAEEAHGRLLQAKADLADAAKTRERQLEEELAKMKSQQEAALQEMTAGHRNQEEEQEKLSRRVRYLESELQKQEAEQQGMEDKIENLEKDRARTRAERDALENELGILSTRLEAQLQHGVELKNELAKLHAELDAHRQEQRDFHESEVKWKHRVGELESALGQARDTIAAQQNHMAEMKSSVTTLPSSEVNSSDVGMLEEAQTSMDRLRSELESERASSEDQRRLTAHLKQKMMTLEGELAAARRQFEEQASREIGLKKQIAQKDTVLSKAKHKIQSSESLNKDLDQAVADLQLDLSRTKSREEASQMKMAALKQELKERESTLNETRKRAKAQQERRRSEEAQAEGLQAQLQMALQLEEAAAQEAEQRLQGLAKAEACLQETWEEELLISRRSCEGLVGSNSDLEVQVRSLQEACEEAHSRAVDLETLETSLRHKVQQLEEEVAESKGARASDQLAIAALQHQVLALESEVGSRQCALETEALAEAEAAEMAKALKAQLQGLEAEHAGLQHALERQSEMEVELHAKAANLKSALEESDGRGQKLEDAGKALEQEVGRLEEELATNRLSSDEDQRRVHALQDQIALLKVEMAARDTSQEMQISAEAELQKQLFEAKARLEAVSLTEGMQQELIARLQGSLNSFETDLSQSRTDLVAQESLRTRLQEDLETLRADCGQREKLASELRLQLTSSEDELSVVNTSYRTLEHMEAQLRSQLGEREDLVSQSMSEVKMQESVASRLEERLTEATSELATARWEITSQEQKAKLVSCDLESSRAKLMEAEAEVQRQYSEECDLQQQLAMVDASLAAALSTNEDQSAAHARLEEGYEQLKSELAAATETGEHHHKSKSQLQDQVAELQGEVAEMHLSCQAKSRQEAELQQRLQRSEAELSMAQSGAKAQQDVASDLKQSLDDVKRELAVRVKEAQEKQDQVSCLQRDGQKAQSKLAEVSKELAGAETRVESFYERCAQQEVRLTKAQGELASARREGESLQGLEADLKSSLAKKEAVLMGALATSETHRANEAALRIALQKQERLLADERVAKDSAERQLLQSSAGVAGLRQELAEATAQRDEHASFGQNLQSKFQHLEAKSEARLEEAAQSESALREKLQDFWGKLNAKPKLQDTNQLNGPRSHFQEKARDARRRVVAVLRRAGDLHHATIELEISRLLQQRGRMFEPTAADAGEAMMQTMMQRLSTRRWRLAQELEGIQEQVKDAIRLNEGTTEGSDEDQLVAERLELDAQLISQDVALLRAHAVLDDVPWAVVKALATASGIILPEDGKEEKYPLHWAAAHGRRDVVEFLLRYPAEDLLNQRDDQGRTPLFYAERAGNDALALYLRERGSDINPQEPIHVRPSGASIPDAYADVIKVVEERGWHAVKWIEGFTLLHWAAERNLADFCRYFVALNADPNAIDSRGRTALKCAMDTNSRDAEMALRELMGLGSPFPAEPTTGMFPQEPVSRSELSRSNLAPSPTDSGGIPEAYIRVMKQIDQIGWEKMCWARGFTLLHWAAKHDRADLCELFLWHGAEVNHRDDSGRSAMDYAQLRQPPALAALEVMQRGKPNHKPVVMLPA